MKKMQLLIEEVNKEFKKDRKGKSSRLPKIPNNWGEYKFEIGQKGVYKIKPSNLHICDLEFRNYGFEDTIEYLSKLAKKLNLPIVTIRGGKYANKEQLKILHEKKFNRIDDKEFLNIFEGNETDFYLDLTEGKMIKLAPFINKVQRFFYALSEKTNFKYERINTDNLYSFIYFFRIFSEELHFDWDGENCILRNKESESLRAFSKPNDTIKYLKDILRDGYQSKKIENLLNPSTKFFEENLERRYSIEKSTSKEIFNTIMAKMDAEKIEIEIVNSKTEHQKEEWVNLLYVFDEYFVFENSKEIYHFKEKTSAFEKFIYLVSENKKKELMRTLQSSWKEWNK